MLEVLFFSFISSTVNTALAPQTSNNYEAGVRHYFTDTAYAHINYFRMDTKQEIIFNPLSFMNENLDGKTRRDGIEISASAKLTEKISVRSSYTYLKAEIKDGTFAGKEVPNVPEHKASVEVVSALGNGFSAAVNGVFIGERPFISDFQNTFSKQKSYTVLNTKLMYEKKAIKAFVAINNLLNKEYSEYGVIGGFPQERAYYPSPKRNLTAGLSVNF